MRYKHRFILLLIHFAVGISYISYNYITLQSMNRLFGDIVVFILLGIILWLLGKHYDGLSLYGCELESAKKEMQELFDNADAMLWSFNMMTHETKVSKGIEKVFGVTNDELFKKSSLEVGTIHPEDKDKVSKFLDDLFSGRESKLDWRIMRDGEIKWIHCSGSPITGKSGRITKLVGVIYDITTQKAAEEKMQQLAYHDHLTNLPNRVLLHDHLNKIIAYSKKNEQTLSVLFIDLDDFKNINDNHGHDTGYKLLKLVALRMKNIVRDEDVVCRLGGDEFVVVLGDIAKNESLQIANRLVSSLAKPFRISDTLTGSITASVGISQFPIDGDTPELLIEKADEAMYYAKRLGKNKAKFHPNTVYCE